MIYDSSGVDRILLSNPDLVKLDEELGNIEIATVVRLDDTKLNDQLNAFIKQYQEDGTADEMVTRWIDNIGGVMPDIPKPANPEKKITIITNGLTEPMNYYENGQLTGYDIEFMKRFANFANLDYEIITMDYAAMIPAIQSGKGDVIISDFFKTNERGQEVLYSDAYVVLHNSVLVRKNMVAEKPGAAAATINSNDDLNGKRVGFITGMVHIEGFRPNYEAEEYEFKDFSSMMEALKSGRVDAMLTSQSKVRKFSIKIRIWQRCRPITIFSHPSVLARTTLRWVINWMRLLSGWLMMDRLPLWKRSGLVKMKPQRYLLPLI